MKPSVLSVVLSLCVAWTGVLSAAPSAEDVVRSTADEVIAKVRAGGGAKIDQTRLNGLIDEMVVPHFDFLRMSRWVLGKHWRRADDGQQTQFVDEFRKLLVRTYAQALAEYTGDQITYHPVQAASDADRVMVKTEIERPSGASIPITYRMHNKDATWKVYDVAVDGVSLVSTYRGSFANEIKKNGLDSLINDLAARNGKPNG